MLYYFLTFFFIYELNLHTYHILNLYPITRSPFLFFFPFLLSPLISIIISYYYVLLQCLFPIIMIYFIYLKMETYSILNILLSLNTDVWILSKEIMICIVLVCLWFELILTLIIIICIRNWKNPSHIELVLPPIF